MWKNAFKQKQTEKSFDLIATRLYMAGANGE